MAEEQAPATDTIRFRRLHPATVIVEILRKLASMAYVIVGAFLVRVMGSEDDWFDYFLVGVIGLSGGLSLARYISLRYGFDGDRLVIRSGIFQRQVRTIPVEKIQDINLKRSVLHRMLGVVDLKIETAVAGQTEAALSVLGTCAADELRAELLRRKQVPPDEQEPSQEHAEQWTTTLKELLLVGATENRAGVIMAAIGGAFYTFNDLGEKIWGPVKEVIEPLLGAGASTAVFLVFVGLALLVLAGWIFSIVLTVVGYHGFTLRRAEDRLRRRYGLFTQVETVVPLRRIQVLRLEAPLLRRLFGFFTVYAETAGSAKDDESGGSTPLCPLVSRQDVDRFCRLAFPELDYDRVEWRPVSRLTIRRGFIRFAALLLAVIAILLTVDWATAPDDGEMRVGMMGLWAVPVALALAALWAWARYRALGYAEMGMFLLARSGVLTRRIWVVPKRKIQSVSLAQSPIQRHLRLADLEIETAGSEFLCGAEIVDLPHETAVGLQDRLSQTANAEGLWLPDGV